MVSKNDPEIAFCPVALFLNYEIKRKSFFGNGGKGWNDLTSGLDTLPFEFGIWRK
jgi:hypothetical protein